MIVKDHKKLAQLMDFREVTHRDLAAAAGYKAHSYISRLTRGEVASLTTDAALRIAHHLGVAVEDLFLPDSSSNSGRSNQSKRMP